MRKKNSPWQKIKKRLTKKLGKKPDKINQEEKKHHGALGEIPTGLKLSTNLQQNLDHLHQLLGDSTDVNIRKLKLGKSPGVDMAVFWVDGLCNDKLISDNVVKALIDGARDIPIPAGGSKQLFEKLKQRYLTIGDSNQVTTWAEVVYAGLSGDAVFLLDGSGEAIVAATRQWESRGIEEPASEVVVRGPREGFTETLRMNTALIRRRLKNPNLRIEGMRIGRQSQTDVAIVYVQGIVNEKTLAEVKKRIDRIDTDAILESSYIEEMIEDAPFSLFPTVSNTERPDSLAASILEGRVGIIVDGTPFALIVPTIFFELFQTPEDYYNRYPLATFSRWLRLTGLLITLLLPSLYIGITTYHAELIPITLLLAISASREGVPFPAVIEALIMEITFEVLREAGIRMPRPVGNAVSIVGALVLGDAAISAGIVSPSMVVIVALTAIASFLIPNPDIVGSIRILRFVMMLLAASLGLFGIMMGVIALHIHLVSLRSFGVPFMWPIAPFNLRALGDVLIRLPHWGYRYRPEMFSWAENQRMSSSDNIPRKPLKSPVKKSNLD